MQFVCTRGVGKPCGAQGQFPGGKVSDPIAVHRHGGGPRRWDHGDAVLFQFRQGRHRKRFDFRDHHIGAMFSHHRQQVRGFGHRQHLRHIGHLHRRCIGVAVAGDHPTAQPLRCNGHLLAQFAAAKEQHGSGKSGHELLWRRISPINQTAMNPRDEMPK